MPIVRCGVRCGERAGLPSALVEDQTRTGVKMSWAWLAGTGLDWNREHYIVPGSWTASLRVSRELQLSTDS